MPELVDAGMLVDVKKFLKDNGKYDSFYPTALKYQEFTDGSMYTLPLEYHVEMTGIIRKFLTNMVYQYRKLWMSGWMYVKR